MRGAPESSTANRPAATVPEGSQVAGLQCDAARLELELSTADAQRLVDFGRLLERWNEKFNLVSRRDVGRLAARHLLDSLSICRWLQGERVLDIGSGAGLPGIPLAMVNANRRFVLVDRSERKARFLEQVVMTFHLDNVEVRCVDAKTLRAEPGFTTIVCRAVASLPQVWRMAEPLLDDRGRLVFMNRTLGHSEVSPEVNPEAQPAFGLPSTLNVTSAQVRIPGLANPHEVLVVEARP
jgi:16S rRNA (guanine527-N7)-methyltransferase